MSYEPLSPSGESARLQWAREIQDMAFRSRRMLVTPDSLTRQTPMGVFHRPKPDDGLITESEPQPQPAFFEFGAAWFLPNGVKSLGTVDPLYFSRDNVTTAITTQNTLVTPTASEISELDAIQGQINSITGVPFPGSVVRFFTPITSGWKIFASLSQTIYGNGSLTDQEKAFYQASWQQVSLCVLLYNVPAPNPPFLSYKLFSPQTYTTWLAGDLNNSEAEIVPAFDDGTSASYMGIAINDTAGAAGERLAAKFFPPGTSISIFGVAYQTH